ncbi:MAG: copper resistance CopC family protein [Pseudolysinimonas sp.]
MHSRRVRLARRRAGMAAIIAAAAVVGPVGLVSPAYGHNALIASTPEAGQTLTELPPQFSITTNEALLALPGSNGFALQIQDAAGAYFGDGCVEVVDATMSADAALGEPGAYTMLWQAVSADGHSVDGAIPFSWAPEGDVDVSASSATPPVCGQAASPSPTANATAAPATSEPTVAPAPASGIDLATVLWIGGALLIIGIALAVAIVLAGRRRSPS